MDVSRYLIIASTLVLGLSLISTRPGGFLRCMDVSVYQLKAHIPPTVDIWSAHRALFFRTCTFLTRANPSRSTALCTPLRWAFHENQDAWRDDKMRAAEEKACHLHSDMELELALSKFPINCLGIGTAQLVQESAPYLCSPIGKVATKRGTWLLLFSPQETKEILQKTGETGYYLLPQAVLFEGHKHPLWPRMKAEV